MFIQQKAFNIVRLFGIAAALIILQAGFAAASTDIVSDTENCLYCHRYPNMGRYDETGQKKIYYVNDKKFAQSVHGKLKCKNCHVGVDQIPHTDVKKVDCSTRCHIKEPSTNREFSHKNMIDKYNASVHGKGPKENPKPFPQDLPTCTYCHDNRIYNPFSGLWGKGDELSRETLGRCEGCHVKEAWAKNFYSHFTHRMRRRRTQTEIVRLCTSCHEDKDKMERHGLESIETFKDTFHWVLVKYDVKNAPDCISCHVPVGYSTHEIRYRNDKKSPINVANRINTCSHQGGVQTCHPGATSDFATGRVHAYGVKAQLAIAKGLAESSGQQNRDQSLISTRAMTDMTEEEVFHFMIIKLVKWFYKILIPLIIGSMCLHQWLEYLSIRRAKKKSHQSAMDRS